MDFATASRPRAAARCWPPGARAGANGSAPDAGADHRVGQGTYRAAAPATLRLPGRRDRWKGPRQRIRAAGARSARGWTGAGGIYRFQEGRQLARAQSRAAAAAGDGAALPADGNATGI